MPPDPPIAMYESSPRSREVANALFQLDKLSENQVRAVLRHITIDDAVLSEAQCSHVASLISGTLHKVPREGVNAALTCSTSLDAASHWEKSFASHPGHVSAIFRKNSTNRENESDQSKQVVLFKPEETAPAPIKNKSTDTNPSLGVNPDLKGLTIVNQGQMTLHYHSYNHASSPARQTATVPRKRALDKADDEEYSEALASLMQCDLSPERHRNTPTSTKRQRLEEPALEMVETEVEKPQVNVKQDDNLPDEPVKTVETVKKGLMCKNCGQHFYRKQNNGDKKPCAYHSGTIHHHPEGVKLKGTDLASGKLAYYVWSCCQKEFGGPGCEWRKHQKDDN